MPVIIAIQSNSDNSSSDRRDESKKEPKQSAPCDKTCKSYVTLSPLERCLMSKICELAIFIVD